MIRCGAKEIVGEIIRLTSFFTKTDVTEQDKESGMVCTLLFQATPKPSSNVHNHKRLLSHAEF